MCSTVLFGVYDVIWGRKTWEIVTSYVAIRLGVVLGIKVKGQEGTFKMIGVVGILVCEGSNKWLYEAFEVVRTLVGGWLDDWLVDK